MTKPLLSVLIDTYNHERYIEQAINSAIEQNFSSADYEILVVDDGSTDRTPEIVRKFAPRVRLVSKKNGGQASAFNAAFPELRGEIVAFLDGDDWFAPGKLTAVMTALDQHPEVAAVGHGFYEFRDETKEVSIRVPEQPQFLRATTPDTAREAFRGWPFLLMGALTVRRRIIEQIRPIPEALVFCADAPISVASMAAGVVLLNKPLFYYRHHSTNLHAFAPEDTIKLRRRLDMNELAFEQSLPMLIRIGVRPDCARALVWPPWIHISRQNLATFGGNPLKAFRTEMRSFHSDFENPSLTYRLFKYLIVAPAALLMPPRRFYKMREWYAQRNLIPVRERLAKSSIVDRQLQLPRQ